MTTIDQQLFKAINGDDGGTWAPSAAITVGGSGLTCTSALVSSGGGSSFSAANITSATFSSGGTFNVASGAHLHVNSGGFLDLDSGGIIDVKNGSTLKIESGGILDMLSGGNIKIESGSELSVLGGTGIVVYSGATLQVNSGAVLALQGSSLYPTFGTPRTIKKAGLHLLAATVSGAAPSSGDRSNWSAYDTFDTTGTAFHIVQTKPLTAAGDYFQVAIPQPVQGAVLSQIIIDTVGGGATPTGFPSYLAERINKTTRAVDAMSADTTDHHQTSGTWALAADTTTVSCTTNNTIDNDTYRYVVRATCPWNASNSKMNVVSVTAVYTVSDLRP